MAFILRDFGSSSSQSNRGQMVSASLSQRMLLSLGVALLALSSSAPAFGEVIVDGTFYENAPAPAPGSCPNGSNNATLDVELTEGPYYVEEDLFRSNVREGEAGVPFHVKITVLDTDCNPVVGALVDIWNCNASGSYSSYTGVSTGGTFTTVNGRKMLQATRTDNSTFLRGTVETDFNGVATFDTIIPGHYDGRATHVHTKVHIGDEVEASLEAEYADSHVAHTGQFFFEDNFLDGVYALIPYSEATGAVRVALADDGVYQGAEDAQLLFEINEVQPGNLSAGVVGSVTAIIEPSANHTTDAGIGGMGMGGGGMGAMVPAGQGMGMPGGAGGMGFPGGGLPPMGSAVQPQVPGQGTLPTLTGRKLAGLTKRT